MEKRKITGLGTTLNVSLQNCPKCSPTTYHKATLPNLSVDEIKCESCGFKWAELDCIWKEKCDKPTICKTECVHKFM